LISYLVRDGAIGPRVRPIGRPGGQIGLMADQAGVIVRRLRRCASGHGDRQRADEASTKPILVVSRRWPRGCPIQKARSPPLRWQGPVRLRPPVDVTAQLSASCPSGGRRRRRLPEHDHSVRVGWGQLIPGLTEQKLSCRPPTWLSRWCMGSAPPDTPAAADVFAASLRPITSTNPVRSRQEKWVRRRFKQNTRINLQQRPCETC